MIRVTNVTPVEGGGLVSLRMRCSSDSVVDVSEPGSSISCC